MITDPKQIQSLRLFILLRFEEKGVTISELCKLNNISYGIWYRRMFSQDTLKFEYINFILELLKFNFKLLLINNVIHKVFQSKMNYESN
jgi:hypothetical protein